MGKNDTHPNGNGADSPHYESEIPSNPAFQIVSVDENGLREMLLKLRDSEKWIADLAAKLGVTAQYLGLVLAGEKPIGPKLQRGMGVVRVRQIYDVEIVMDEGNDE